MTNIILHTISDETYAAIREKREAKSKDKSTN